MQLTVVQLIFDGSFEVERLNERSLVQGERVADTTHLNAFCRHSNTQLWVFPYTSLYNVS